MKRWATRSDILFRCLYIEVLKVKAEELLRGSMFRLYFDTDTYKCEEKNFRKKIHGFSLRGSAAALVDSAFCYRPNSERREISFQSRGYCVNTREGERAQLHAVRDSSGTRQMMQLRYKVMRRFDKSFLRGIFF